MDTPVRAHPSPHEAFALLDDARDPAAANSRLYTGWVETLRNENVARLDEFWNGVEARLASGLHAVVVIDYEWGVQLNQLPTAGLPALEVRLFKALQRLPAAEVAAWLTRSAPEGVRSPAGFTAWTPSVSRAAFDAAIAQVHRLITAGETYQVNYTYRLSADAYGEPVAIYQALRQRQPVAYGALISPAGSDGRWILSFSPELFMRQAGGHIVTSPMKGTAPRQPDPVLDAEAARDLSLDTKNRAENVMIVDLLRNDVARVAVTGSVEVPELFSVQTLPTVHQMTSTVTARLRPDVTIADTLRALFPCGSITGAPKYRTMQLISQLESTPRGIYCGAIGWVEAAPSSASVGDFCLSVAIRTLTLAPPQKGLRRAAAGVGGGVVYDSTARGEFDETLTKTRFLREHDSGLTLFETMRVESPEASPLRFTAHLARLAAGACALGFAFDEGEARAAVSAALAGHPGAGPLRLRLTLAKHGACRVSLAPLAPSATHVLVAIAPKPLPLNERALIHHKTSLRHTYDEAIAAAESAGAFDLLFFNEDGELTEGARSNVFLRRGDEWVTPPLACGVLPGIMRADLLGQAGYREAVIYRGEVIAARELFVCNSLRGVMPARLTESVGAANLVSDGLV